MLAIALAGCSSSATDSASAAACVPMSPAQVTYHSDCSRCDVRNAGDAADGRNGSYAVVRIPKGATGSIRLRAQRAEGSYPGGSFGALVSARGSLDLSRDIVIRSLKGGAQATTSFGMALGDAEVDGPQALRVVTQAAYDAIEIVIRRSEARDAAELRVHEFCGA